MKCVLMAHFVMNCTGEKNPGSRKGTPPGLPQHFLFFSRPTSGKVTRSFPIRPQAGVSQIRSPQLDPPVVSTSFIAQLNLQP